jgi:hypothetical protein
MQISVLYAGLRSSWLKKSCVYIGFLECTPSLGSDSSVEVAVGL